MKVIKDAQIGPSGMSRRSFIRCRCYSLPITGPSAPPPMLCCIFLALVLLIPFCSTSSSDSAIATATHLRGEFSREDIALLYSRLAEADKHREAVTKKTTKGTSASAVTSPTRGKGTRKIVPPVVSAVLTAATVSTRPPSITTALPLPPTAETMIDESSNAMAFNSDVVSLMQVTRVGAIVLLGLFLSAITSIGNALVMISICVDKKLQTISNFFLFSLAAADLTIGIISIPLMTLYTASQTWRFGYSLCQFWLCIDYLMCNASVLNLLLISFDRYFSVTRPLTYRPKRTMRKALFLIAGSYILSLILWPPWIILWPHIEGRFIVEESSLCVVQFLALGDNRNWRNQLATVGTAAAAFYIPVTLMIVLYYKVYLETKRRQKELRKLQDGQPFSPTRLAGTSALHSLMLPLAPLIRGLQPPASSADPFTTVAPVSASLRQTSIIPQPNSPKKGSQPSKPNFFDFMNNFPTMQLAPSFRKKERFSLLKFCTGKAQADLSSEDSLAEECAAIEDTSVGGGLTTSNLDSIVAETGTPVELVVNHHQPTAVERTSSVQNEQTERGRRREREKWSSERTAPNPDLERTSRPSSVHTYNSIVIIEYSDGQNHLNQRPSVRLSSHAEVESLSARNSVERQTKQYDGLAKQNEVNKERTSSEKNTTFESTENENEEELQKRKLTKTKSCPQEREKGILTRAGTVAMKNSNQHSQQNGLMTREEIQRIREENMRRCEKERRRNERKQESKAAKTLSAILFAFIITWTPYNVIVCLEAFYPNSVAGYLFTLSYFFCYVNSTINPLCYALCNARFRMTYMRIIQCKWRRRNNSMQQHFRDSSYGRTSSGRRVLLKRHSKAMLANK